jgi:FecR protein
MTDQYLWDKSGPEDAEVARLERALGSQRWSGRVPEQAPASLRRRWTLVAGLAALVLAVLGIALLWRDRGASYRFDPLEGSPVVEGGSSFARSLRSGDVLSTDAKSRAKLEVADLGNVVLEPGTRVRIERPEDGAGGAQHVLALERGTIVASIFAAPRAFQLGTPAGIAVDLGCVYRTTVEEDGSTRLAVVSGQVSFEARDRRAIVPAGAWCRARPGAGPGPAFREDAPAALVEAAERLQSQPTRAEIEALLAAARPVDTLTLWHLLEHPSAEVRSATFDALAALAPPPEGLDRAALIHGDRASLDTWRRTMDWSW